MELTNQMRNWTVTTVLVFLLLFFILERLFPLRAPRRPLLHRLWVNGGLSIITFAVAAFLVRPASFSAIRWSSETHFGLLQWLKMPFWLQAIAGFLLMDLSFYYWHRLNHEVSFLWRFHNVHHLDPDLDASTGFRFHFGEVGLSVFFRVAQVTLLGIPIQIFLFYELVFQLETYFHHSNLRLPRALDRAVNVFLVTPRMHGIHHSQIRKETDSNYSVIFSFWDRLHRTFRSGIAESEVKIGVPGYSDPESNSFINALIAPFRKQSEYWCLPANS